MFEFPGVVSIELSFFDQSVSKLVLHVPDDLIFAEPGERIKGNVGTAKVKLLLVDKVDDEHQLAVNDEVLVDGTQLQSLALPELIDVLRP